jgi:hypothetical protein
MRNRVLLVINGESYRVGPQFSRNRDGGEHGIKCQLLSTLSHLRLMRTIKERYGLESDVYLSTYNMTEELDRKLVGWYEGYLVGMEIYPRLFSKEQDFVNSTISKLREVGLDKYTHIIFVRMDYFLKRYLNKIFKLVDDKVMFSFFDANCGGNATNHGFFVTPHSYFDHLVNGRIWDYHWSFDHTNRNVPNASDSYLYSYHLCCPSLEWNPLFSYPGRHECLTYPNEAKVYRDLEHYISVYKDLIGTDTISENMGKIDTSLSIEKNLSLLEDNILSEG